MNIKIEDSNGKKKYWVNDVAYDRLEDIPSEFQKYFADKDNNGVPDQFDQLNDLQEKLRTGKLREAVTMFNAFSSSKTESTKIQTPVSNPYNGNAAPEGSTLKSSLTKILLGVGLVLLVAWLYPKYKEYKNSTDGSQIAADSTSSTVVALDGAAVGIDSTIAVTTAPPAEDEMVPESLITLTVDDSNQATSHMLGIAMQDGKSLFTFELPDGAAPDVTDSTIQVDVTRAPGTTLDQKTFTLEIQPLDYALPEYLESKSNKTIAGIAFETGDEEDSGMSQYRTTLYYTFPKYGKVFVFKYYLHSTAPGVVDGDLKNYDYGAEVAGLENMLNTIKFNP